MITIENVLLEKFNEVMGVIKERCMLLYGDKIIIRDEGISDTDFAVETIASFYFRHLLNMEFDDDGFSFSLIIKKGKVDGLIPVEIDIVQGNGEITEQKLFFLSPEYQTKNEIDNIKSSIDYMAEKVADQIRKGLR